MAVLRRQPPPNGDFGGTKLSLLLEKQHNRGQDGAGVAILAADPVPGEVPYWIAKSASATPLADVLGMIGKRPADAGGRIFLGHLRYATFGKNDAAFCHPFIHPASELGRILLLAGNFNLTNTAELFEAYRRQGEFPTSRSDGYLICEMIAHELAGQTAQTSDTPSRVCGGAGLPPIAAALSAALAEADGAWTLCGMTGDGWAFATRDPHGIRPGWFYVDDNVAVVASERPAIQAAFDVPPDAVQELPPGQAMVISPEGEIAFFPLGNRVSDAERPHGHRPVPRPCVFERIYFSRANDADIHRERKALGAALVPQILKAADAPASDLFFSYIPNSARIAFHGLLEELFRMTVNRNAELFAGNAMPRFGEVAVKDAKFRTFIADAGARREFYKHVYDVTYGLVRPHSDTLVVLDDSIVRGNTMRNAILPMLDRLEPKRIIIASSAPPIRYPDCYGIDMSTLGELVAFRALVNLLGDGAESELRAALAKPFGKGSNPLAPLYARFPETEHAAEIARLLTPPEMKAEVIVVFQTVEALHAACPAASGDWYFTGDYPTPGGYRVLRNALLNYLGQKNERSY
ncbi:MAG: amidophosphoribosyltransferase [Kiritimatiellae bacterium]|nr:amidophosphoribosyltransferase [Kiritimatiellia bacterium]